MEKRLKMEQNHESQKSISINFKHESMKTKYERPQLAFCLFFSYI